jgi:hypothetical protein
MHRVGVLPARHGSRDRRRAAVGRRPSPCPAGQPAVPEEIAAAITYLAGNKASFVHGAILDVDDRDELVVGGGYQGAGRLVARDRLSDGVSHEAAPSFLRALRGTGELGRLEQHAPQRRFTASP